MTMESIILSNSMCLHCRLAMVLPSSFNGNHWWLGCAVHECVCKHVCVWSRENCTNSYKLVKNNKTFPFCTFFLFVLHITVYLTLWAIILSHESFYQDSQIHLPLEVQESSSFYSFPPITWMKN